MAMKTKEKPFRHELKYVIGEPEKALLTERFKHLIQLDKHATNGGYTIRSLYFDDYWNSAYAEKMQVFWFVRSIGFVSIISVPIVSN